MDLLDEEQIEGPVTGVAKNMDRKGLPKGAELNAVGVKLNNNNLTNLDELEAFLEEVLDDPMELRWLDLSNNFLKTVDPVLLKYPKLTVIYLHGNQITKFNEVDKLRELSHISKLTLHGNPIEEMRNYRLYMVCEIPTLRSLDFIGITKVDRDRVMTWDKERQAARARREM